MTRAVRHRGLEHPQGELRVAREAVEEVLGVEQHLHACVAEELDGVSDHRNALVERGAQRFGHVVVPRLPDDAHSAHVGLDEVAQRVVAVDLAFHATGRPERDQRARLELQLLRHPPEQLVVLRVRARPSGFDVVHTEPVELLRDPQLVLDGEGDALELSAVAERRVIDLDLFGRVHAASTSGPLPPVRRATATGPPDLRLALIRAHTSPCTCRSRPAQPGRIRPR